MNARESMFAVQVSAADAILRKHLPGKSLPEQRIYAAMARKGFEEGRVTEEEFALVCDLVRQKLIVPGSSVETFVCEKLGVDHRHVDGTSINDVERGFFLELAEWHLLGAMGKGIVQLVRQRFLKALEVPTVESVRSEFKINFESIMAGAKIQGFNPNYREIPHDVIPLLSHEARQMMFETSRKTRFSGKEAFNSKVIHYSQDKVLRKSLGKDETPVNHDDEEEQAA